MSADPCQIKVLALVVDITESFQPITLSPLVCNIIQMVWLGFDTHIGKLMNRFATVERIWYLQEQDFPRHEGGILLIQWWHHRCWVKVRKISQ